MAVMVIIGILAAVVVKKVDAVSDSAALRLLQAGIAELNARELLVWTNHKFASRGAISDPAVWDDVDTALGARYTWIDGPADTGGTLSFESVVAALTRTPATDDTAARWK
jgi:hypothetical protein